MTKPAERTRAMQERHRTFVRRLRRNTAAGAGIIAGSLALGVVGYHFLAGLAWVDALQNASMILSGMGPVNPMPTDGAKIFASAYALFSGVVFISTAGLIIAPIAHRAMRRLHMEMDEEKDTSGRK